MATDSNRPEELRKDQQHHSGLASNAAGKNTAAKSIGGPENTQWDSEGGAPAGGNVMSGVDFGRLREVGGEKSLVAEGARKFDSGNIREQLRIAVSILATHASPLKERIQLACTTSHLHLHHKRDFPPGLRRQFAALLADLSASDPVGHEGSLAATLRVASEEQATQLARQILDLYVSLVEIDTLWDE